MIISDVRFFWFDCGIVMVVYLDRGREGDVCWERRGRKK